MKIKKEIERLKGFWDIRNPQHEINADTDEDMFWGTVLMIFNDMNQADDENHADKSIISKLVISYIKTLEAERYDIEPTNMTLTEMLGVISHLKLKIEYDILKENHE